MQDFSRIKHANREYRFGSDPEIFSRDSKGQIVPAYTFLPSKDKPIVKGDVGTPKAYSCVYNDGFQAEMRAAPYACIAYVVDTIHNGLKAIWEKSNGAALVLDNAPMIPISVLREAPEEHVILGCDPSENAYNIGGRTCGDPRKLRYRFTGLHVHASGWELTNDYEERRKLFVPYIKAFDAILGVYFVAAGAHLESKKRREYYGLAGEYRLPPHGLEYRVLSPIGLAHPGITNLIFELTRGVIAVVDSGAQNMWVADEQETIGVINENNQKAARALIDRNKNLLAILSGFGRGYRRDSAVGKDAVYNMAMNGIDSVVKDPADFVKNWKFEDQWIGHGDGRMESWAQLAAKR